MFFIETIYKESQLEKIRGVLIRLTSAKAFEARSEAFRFLNNLRWGDVELTVDEERAMGKMLKENDFEGLMEFFKSKNGKAKG